MITEDSFIDFKCPSCGDSVSFPEAEAGFTQPCPICSETLIVPADGSGLGRAVPLPLTTPRLVLRRLAARDWKDLLELFADDDLYQFTEGRPLDEDEVLHWLESDPHVKLTTPDQVFHLALELQDGQKLIGFLGLSFNDPQRRSGSMRLFVNREYRRKGIATEALQGLIGFCFTGINLHRLSAGCDGRDVAACRLFEKTGFRREGEFVKNKLAAGQWVNTIWYGMLAEEYQPSR